MSASLSTQTPLVDGLGRVHRSLRLSVIDACNIRCQYCMPESSAAFLKADGFLSPEDLHWLISKFALWGVDNVRLTGGEPLLRKELSEIVAELARIAALKPLSLTTNGMLLADSVQQLAKSGLRRVNISLDTLREEVFKRLTRRDGLERVFAGIAAAMEVCDLEVKLNALLLREVNLSEVVDLVRFAREKKIEIRFIEFMPLDASRSWSRNQVVTGHELRSLLEQQLGHLKPAECSQANRPARNYSFSDGYRIGFIDSVSAPFCSSCDRLRVTADGKLQNCLFGQNDWDLRPAIASRDVELLRKLVDEALLQKKPSHGIDSAGFQNPPRAMYQIGG